MGRGMSEGNTGHGSYIFPSLFLSFPFFFLPLRGKTKFEKFMDSKEN